MQGEMEKMRLTSWGNGTTAGTGTDITTVSGYPLGPTVIPINNAYYTSVGDVGSRMTMTRTVADVHPGMIKVTLKITWTTHDKRTLSRSYVTYYGQNGLYDFFHA